jgi:Leucine-rich repeat (LRR) protein
MENYYDSETKTFDCSNKNLGVLREIPSETEVFICSHNYLTKLPTLPENLRVLNCSHNQLTSIGPVNRKLIYLDATHNNLQTFPNITNMIEIYEDNRNNHYDPIHAKVLLKYNPFMKKMKEMKKYDSFIKQKNQHLAQHQDIFMTNNYLTTNHHMNNVNVGEYKKFITLGKKKGNITKKVPDNMMDSIQEYLYGRRGGNQHIKSRKMNKLRKPTKKKVTKQRKPTKKNKSKPRK